ncbi:serine protease Do [Granulicella rosea]|uniref:Serine protease Do n=1 Tax=Granulicella rosea TaxID=474952 RepID=A0A239J808_9BACT|nr:trypsin-like peptidase domain-containing protein [Granulicella rosea]SNT01393.1 serine protease Do [Granulicella rosea]
MESQKPHFFTRLRSHRLTTTFTLLATLSIGVLAGSVLTRSVSGKEQQGVDSSSARPLVIPNPTNLSNGFSAIAKQVGPAVVNINTESLPKESPKKKRRPGAGGQGGGQGDPQSPEDFFNRFFGGQGGGQGDDDGDGQGGGERRALGSGFIVDSQGYIITNNHVVDKADKIFVKLASDHDEADEGVPARVVGVDPETDIAVIKIDVKTPLPTVKLGNSDGAQVGDWVLAIGSPFSLSQTVTAGIVSAKNRSIDDRDANGLSKQFQKFIQTDAAINPGNSGGPLVDMAGQVVGMNTAIYTQSMGSQGVGFAMPSNIVASVYNMLIGPEHKVIRGSIGITFQAAQSSAVNRIYGYGNGGIIITTVSPTGGAAKAGLQPNDVIISIDGRKIADGDDMVQDISARKVGSSVKIGYVRDGKQMTASVTIGDRAKTYSDITANTDDDAAAPQQADAGESKLGITVSPLPAAQAAKLGIKGGVTITSVRPGSFADEINLGKGALITEINKKPVTDMASYNAIVSGLNVGDDVVFVIRNTASKQGGNSFVGGTIR